MYIDKYICQETYNLIRNYKLPKTSNRPNASGLRKLVQWGRNKGTNTYDKVGFPTETMNFGLVRKRFCNDGNPNIKFNQPIQFGNNNHKYPKIYKQLQKLIKYIDPNFDYDTITLNHQFKCRPHYDKNNKSPSIIVGFGDYEGGELVVEGEEFNIRHAPLMFNGGQCKHWTNEWIGDRYSVIYFKIT
tara:strand:+ start:396 stop:956 length:561 start_codon:yes stop_codon:yes gene_type:complete